MNDKNLFLTDRMLGALTRYLRFMGYDTKSAVFIAEGGSREDTYLLNLAKKDGRYLLTRDCELAKRGLNEFTLYIKSDDVLCQVKQLFLAGLIDRSPEFGMQRCVVCNSQLRPANSDEIKEASYAPGKKNDLDFMWCPLCRKLYWAGTHSVNMQKRLKKVFDK
ncbi:MAG: Mut7-C RNAse domain-containing protein [Methanomicrobium sp.]|nr:Mut7-C RNAse domain-containing protein [Methanomicrobium sp.]